MEWLEKVSRRIKMTEDYDPNNLVDRAKDILGFVDDFTISL